METFINIIHTKYDKDDDTNLDWDGAVKDCQVGCLGTFQIIDPQGIGLNAVLWKNLFFYVCYYYFR